MKLNNRAVDNAKPREKKWKLADGGGLHLLVHPNGGKYWRYSGKRNGGDDRVFALLLAVAGAELAEHNRPLW